MKQFFKKSGQKATFVTMMLMQVFFSVKAQYCLTGSNPLYDYQDNYIYDPASPSTDEIREWLHVPFATYSATYNYGGGKTLMTNIYYPQVYEEETGVKHPVIALCPGGGFKSVGIDGTDFADLCQRLAAKGYVVFGFEYRVGRDEGATACDDPLNGEGLKKAIWRAVQDQHAILRSIVAIANGKYDEGGGTDYNLPFIDPDNIILGGASAGSMSAMLSKYYNPTEIQTLLGNFVASLGGIKADKTTNNWIDDDFHPSATYPVKCLVDLWGAVPNVNDDGSTSPDYTSYIATETDGSDKIPMISFHGTEDETFPYPSGAIKGCTSGQTFYYPEVNSQLLYTQLTGQSVCSDLYVETEGDHGWEVDGPVENPLFNNDFIAKEIADFIRSIFCTSCSSHFYTDVDAKVTNVSPSGSISAGNYDVKFKLKNGGVVGSNATIRNFTVQYSIKTTAGTYAPAAKEFTNINLNPGDPAAEITLETGYSIPTGNYKIKIMSVSANGVLDDLTPTNNAKEVTGTASRLSESELIAEEKSMIYPNPFTTSTKYYSSDEMSNLKIFDLSGKEIVEYPYCNSETLIGYELPAGIYLAVIQRTNSPAIPFRLVKQ